MPPSSCSSRAFSGNRHCTNCSGGPPSVHPQKRSAESDLQTLQLCPKCINGNRRWMIILCVSSLFGNFKTLLNTEYKSRGREHCCSLSYGSGHMILTLDSWNLLIFLISLPNLRSLNLLLAHLHDCFVFWHLYCVCFLFYTQYFSHVTRRGCGSVLVLIAVVSGIFKPNENRGTGIGKLDTVPPLACRWQVDFMEEVYLILNHCLQRSLLSLFSLHTLPAFP